MYFVYLSFSSAAKEVDILSAFTLWFFFVLRRLRTLCCFKAARLSSLEFWCCLHFVRKWTLMAAFGKVPEDLYSIISNKAFVNFSNIGCKSLGQASRLFFPPFLALVDVLFDPLFEALVELFLFLYKWFKVVKNFHRYLTSLYTFIGVHVQQWRENTIDSATLVCGPCWNYRCTSARLWVYRFSCRL